MKRRRLLIFSVLIVALVVGGCGLWVSKAKRQYALNRQLIAALIHSDTRQALVLINAGADPNAELESPPVPTLDILLVHLLHRMPVTEKHSNTAFSIACGADWYKNGETFSFYPEDPALVRAMLVHGAKRDATDEYGRSALCTAVFVDYPHVARLLLEYGCNSNEQDGDGRPLIMTATQQCSVEMVAVLLEHGANVACVDQGGDTPLQYVVRYHSKQEVIRVLMNHGANPQQQNANGVSALMLAQWQHRSDIVALLQKGAK